MTQANPVVIVGGGIGGLAAALALSQKSITSLLIEQANEFREVGAGIQVGPNGYRVLETLGIADKVAELAVLPDDLIFMDGVTEKQITSIPTGAAFRDRFKYPYSLVHRADLHSVLLEACRESELVQFQGATKVVSYEDTGTSVSVFTDKGEPFQASALIGADGLWSKVRERIVGDGAPVVSGHIAYRAVLPIEDVPVEFRRNAMILWGGPKCHLVQYPLRGGKLFNLVAVFHSDKYVEGWNTEGDREELIKRFAGTCPTVQTLLSKIDSWRMWVLCDRQPVKQWCSGRSVLLGDAAHPMLQYLAQGACMAMEDAVVLADEMSRANGRYAGAFEKYQARRYLRTGRCQVMARVHGDFYHAEGVVAELRNGMLAKRTAEQAYDGLSWLYDAVI